MPLYTEEEIDELRDEIKKLKEEVSTVYNWWDVASKECTQLRIKLNELQDEANNARQRRHSCSCENN